MREADLTTFMCRTNIMEIWEPKAPGTLWALPGLLGGSTSHAEFNNSDKICRENQNRHFMFSNSPLPPHPRKLCLFWDSAGKYGWTRQATDDNIISRMRIACWITKATDTHKHTYLRIVKSYCFSMATMVTWTRLTVTLYVHCLSCPYLQWKWRRWPPDRRLGKFDSLWR